MPDTTELKALRERVRAAKEPDRRIDASIALPFKLVPEGMERSPLGDGLFCFPGSWSWRPPDHSSSIDVAVALVERVLPAANAYGFDKEQHCFSAFVSRNFVKSRSEAWMYEGGGSTAPLAILDALLSALLATVDQPKGERP